MKYCNSKEKRSILIKRQDNMKKTLKISNSIIDGNYLMVCVFTTNVEFNYY